MKVKDLKEILSQLPPDMTEQEFDELDVRVYTIKDEISIADKKFCGPVTFMGETDEFGKEILDSKLPEFNCFLITDDSVFEEESDNDELTDFN